MAEGTKRDRLLPWYIGLVVILAIVIWIGYQMFAVSCPAPSLIEAMVLIIIPAVYLTLMYLTFKSQD